jgi:Uncharacterized protein conserved in bacteria (DUF2330)
MNRCIVLALFCACFLPSAFGDGKIFVPRLAKARIPDQSALICFDGKTERLVIENRFEGDAKEMAWVVPLPAAPEIEAATLGLFPTLHHITRSRVAIPMREALWFAFVLVSLSACLWFGMLTGRWITSLLLILGSMGLACFLFLATVVAGGEALTSPADGVTVMARQSVGVYDTVTLSGSDGTQVVEWLIKNGFHVDEAIGNILTDYAQKGWVFAAARVKPESRDGRVHPLSFTFPASEAVYPMRLTTTGNGPLSVRLYVVGDNRAAAPGLRIERAVHLDTSGKGYVDGHGYHDSSDSIIPVSHALLKRYVANGSFLTVLEGNYAGDQPADDISLAWEEAVPFRKVFHVRHDATKRSVLAGALGFSLLTVLGVIIYLVRNACAGGWRLVTLWVACVAMPFVGAWLIIGVLDGDYPPIVVFLCVLAAVILMVAFWHVGRMKRLRARTEKPIWRRPFAWGLGVSLLIAGIVGISTYGSMRKVSENALESRETRHATLQWVDLDEIAAKQKGGLSSDEKLAGMRRSIREAFVGSEDFRAKTVFPREEDSPGNYMVELKDGVPIVYQVGEHGQKYQIWPYHKRY